MSYEEEKAKNATRMREWRANNPEQAKARDRSYYERNREKLKARARAAYHDNRDLNLARAAAYRAERREELAAKQRAYWRANPERALAVQRKAKYGVTELDVYTMRKMQNNRCAICGGEFEKTPHVDHCHHTQSVRGLLCHHCNLGIGHFKDSPALLIRAVDYIENARR